MIDRAKEIFREEIRCLTQVGEMIDASFTEAVEAIYDCHGKVVIMGIGKTGIIGHKIASSLASTGTSAIFVNAAEAVHGDLGMVAASDLVLLISNSGSTNEILHVIAPIRQIGCRIIAMTGDTQSPLAKEADIVLSTHVDHEVCPLNLAPTTSTTAALMMGDALTVCLMEKRHFRAENFAVYHPGGALGRQLLSRVCNRMSTDLPRVCVHATFKEVVAEVTAKHLGTTFVYDQGKAVGIITDGDIRRAIQRFDDIRMVEAKDIMSCGYKHIHASALLTEALAELDKYNITTLAVTATPDSIEPIGIISIHHIIDFN